MPEPVPFEPSYERIGEHERQTEVELIETLEKIQNKVYKDTGQALRGVHAKCHGLIRGTLEVVPDLPPLFAQGLFAAAGNYAFILRLSTIPGDLLDDDISVPRGMAIKILGAHGERAAGSEEATTQDFVLANGPVFAKPDGKGFLKSLKLLAATTDKAPGLKKVLSAVMRGTEHLLEALGTQSSTVMQLGGYPETHILGDEFYSQAPLLFGRYMAKVRVVPASPELRALAKSPLDLKGKPDGIREAVRAHFQQDGGRWALQAQLCTDLEKMPIEDASKEWAIKDSPFVTVAILEAAPQDVWSDARRDSDGRLSFSPWHALAAHRPLGGIMRLRRRTYAVTAALRAQRNGYTLGEPAAASELPE